MADLDAAQRSAQAVLDEYGFEDPFVDVYKIAADKGIDIIPVVPQPGDKEFSGFLDSNGDQPEIYINAQEPVARQTWTIGHELGHYFLGHKPDNWGINWRDQTSEEKNEFERAADHFAANLLIPQTMLTSTMAKYKLQKEDYALLAELFGVSQSAMKNRLDFLQIQ